ncbi:MAG: kynureninase [Betaproteobacteria bacterium]|nr:MAG: kynureninase [Betaproteobacteria bacterium]
MTNLSTHSAARDHALALDRVDPLAHCRARFTLPDGVIYLDGNSLGALPKGVNERLHRAINEEWGVGLIRSWNDADWYPAPQRVGAKIAALIGANANEVISCDSTTVNLFKVLCAALEANPERDTIICEEGNFPTDAYITERTAKLYGKRVVLANQNTIESVIAEVGSLLCAVALTHVHYKTGRMYNMQRITELAQLQGARIIWDLAHTGGVIAVQLHDWRVDYAVGCGYKYLNGGPGAPAYVYVRDDLIAALDQPLAGWHGHAAPFSFEQGYRAHAGIDRMLVGTASQLSLISLEAALAAYDGVAMTDVRAKSESLTGLFIELFDAQLGTFGFDLVTPREAAQRGSQVSFSHPDGYAIMQAVIARGVIGDFRAPNILRYGFAPLYLTHVDIANAIAIIADVMGTGEWKRAEFSQKKAVT